MKTAMRQCDEAMVGKGEGGHAMSGDCHLKMTVGDESNEMTIKATSLKAAKRLAEKTTEEWIRCAGFQVGWHGISIEAEWSLTDARGKVVAADEVLVELEPDHELLIDEAGGDNLCNHRWIFESAGGTDGCHVNPAEGWTSSEHCRRCGLRRIWTHVGRVRLIGRSPGEADDVEYRQPATWCQLCQNEECKCV